jgi:hypothetical protein
MPYTSCFPLAQPYKKIQLWIKETGDDDDDDDDDEGDVDDDDDDDDD